MAASVAIKVSVQQSLGEGRYVITHQGGGSPDVAAVSAAITAALANGTISGDGTALGLVTAIQTAMAPVVAALNTNVSVVYDPSAITSRNQLVAALRELQKAAAETSKLTQG